MGKALRLHPYGGRRGDGTDRETDRINLAFITSCERREPQAFQVSVPTLLLFTEENYPEAEVISKGNPKASVTQQGRFREQFVGWTTRQCTEEEESASLGCHKPLTLSTLILHHWVGTLMESSVQKKKGSHRPCPDPHHGHQRTPASS